MSLTWTVGGQICGRSECGTLSRLRLSTPSQRKDFPLETNTETDKFRLVQQNQITSICESGSMCVMGVGGMSKISGLLLKFIGIKQKFIIIVFYYLFAVCFLLIINTFKI